MSAAAFRLATKVFINRNLAPAAIAGRLADYARKDVARLIAEGRAAPTYRRFVDGVEGAQESAVRPDGEILYQFSYIADVAAFAVAFLRARSPVGPGAPKSRSAPGPYRDAFMIGVNGRAVPAASFQPRSVPLDAELIIYNRQPYSRKVDVQLVGGKLLKFSVPAGIFDDCARAIRGRFGNRVNAKRVYNVDHPNKYMRVTGQPVQSPAVVISPVG
jgi:hypothetical protein